MYDNTENITEKKEYSPHNPPSCRFNNWVDCSKYGSCARCGWNPEAPKRRVNWINGKDDSWKYKA